MNKKKLLSLCLGCVLSALMLYLALRNVPLLKLMIYLRDIRYVWLLPTAVVVLFTFVLRTFRWQIILRSAERISFWQAFHPLMIGYMMNCVLPGRVGELARPLLLKKERQVHLTTGLATVVAERIFDILFLIVLFMAVFSKIFNQQGVAVNFGSVTLDNQTLQMIAWGLVRLSLLLLALILIVAIPWSRAFVINIVAAFTRLPVLAGPGKIRALIRKTAFFIQNAIENVAVGFSLVFDPVRLVTCLLLSASIWGLTLISYMVLDLGFPDIQLSARDWTTVMVVVCFFIALPSAPGFWGLWEAGGIFALSLFGIGAKEAAAMTLVAHAVQMLPVILVGLISAAMTSVNIFRISDLKKQIVAAN